MVIMPYVFESTLRRKQNMLSFAKKIPHSAAWYFQKSYFASSFQLSSDFGRSANTVAYMQSVWPGRSAENYKFACCPKEKAIAQLGNLCHSVRWVPALID